MYPNQGCYNMTEKILFMKMHNTIGPIKPLLVFLLSSTWQVIPKKEKM